jgi:hypothetical protein
MSGRADRIEVREMKDEELPQVLRLWEEAGWGEVGSEGWAARHRDGPHGPSHLIVAVDGDGVLGQVTVLRTALNVRGSTERAARVFGVIMSPEFRRRAGYLPLPSHPILRMLTRAIDTAAADGAVAVYALPDNRVMRIASLAARSARTTRFSFWSRPIDRMPAMPASHETVSVVAPEDIDALWLRCRGDLVCTVRDAPTLAWKSLFAPLRIEGVHRHGELVAVVASRGQGDRQWLVEDLLAVDHEARVAALLSVVRAAEEESGAREIRKVGALVAPGLEPALTEGGFAPDDYTFNLFVNPVDPTYPVEKIEPSRWYLSPND